MAVAHPLKALMKKTDDEDEVKPEDKSKARRHQCQNLGHYANQKKLPEKAKSKKEKAENADVVVEEGNETSLLMAIEDFDNEIVPEGISQTDLKNGLWFLDTGKKATK